MSWEAPVFFLPPDESQEVYSWAEAIYDARVAALKEIGALRQPTDIQSEWEQDDHFDDLWRLHRQVYWELSLPWPPSIEAETEPACNPPTD